jgi:Asp23 family, cell envelope-related function
VTEPLVLPGPEGSITLASTALTRLVVGAAESVDGARVRRPRRSVDVARSGGRVSVSLDLVVSPGATVPGLARAVQERVGEAVSSTCGLEVERVDLTIAEIG